MGHTISSNSFSSSLRSSSSWGRSRTSLSLVGASPRGAKGIWCGRGGSGIKVGNVGNGGMSVAVAAVRYEDMGETVTAVTTRS